MTPFFDRCRSSYLVRLRTALLGWIACGAIACRSDSAPSLPAATPPPPRAAVAPRSDTRSSPASPQAEPEAVERPRPTPREPAYGSADLDPDNDDLVAPPIVVPDCEQRLTSLGVSFRPAELPLKQRRGAVFTCGAEQAVLYLAGPTEARFQPRPVVTCHMALALARFELLVQEHAERQVGSRVRSIHQMGTYSCRKMAAFPTLVSEHSYANAIDVRRFVLRNGREIRVAPHFGRVEAPPDTPRSKFLRGLAQDLYDQDVFSVVLTPFFNRDHRDHFHLDLARYRVDGTRP